MTCAADMVRRWVDHVTGKPVRGGLRVRSVNVFGEGDILYSYGFHFQLARALRDKRGNVTGFLLNGDRYSVTTARHQSETRAAIERTGMPHCIIPFAALSAAGVDMSTVAIVDAFPDGWERKAHSSRELPAGAQSVVVPAYGDIPLTDDEITTALDEWHARKLAEWQRARAERDAAAARLANRTSTYVKSDEWAAGRDIGPEPLRADVKPSDVWQTYGWHGPRLVDGIPCKRGQTGTRTIYGFGLRRSRRRSYPGPESHGWDFTGPTITRNDDGTYRWETYRHWLGESVIRARVATVTRKRCKACGGTGRGIGPENHRTVEWHPVGTYATAPDGTRWVSDWPTCPDCNGNGAHVTHGTRPAVFLSGFDRNESRRSYFLCELPASARGVATVDEAYESLKPEAVRVAESVGRTVRRQGDIFAIELPSVTLRELTRAGGVRERMGTLLGTNHVATDVVRLNGVTYARGCLTHAPRFRRPDHARVKLADGKAWHVIVKNTVPLGK